MTESESHHEAGGDLCVALVPLFQGLSHEQQLGVASVARSISVPAGEQTYASEALPSELVVVHTGRFKVSRVDAAGHEQILRVLGPGDFIGESAFLTGRGPDYLVTALESGSACVFGHRDLDGLVRRHPSIGFRMLQSVSRRLDATEARLASAISGDVSSRLTSYLLSLPAQHASTGLEVSLPLAKKDIASLLDTTPESLSRQLRRLQESGIIDQPGGPRVVLRDVDALMELSAT